MHNPHSHYSKSHANRRMWLDDSVKQFYTVNVYKLNPTNDLSNIKNKLITKIKSNN